MVESSSSSIRQLVEVRKHLSLVNDFQVFVASLHGGGFHATLCERGKRDREWEAPTLEKLLEELRPLVPEEVRPLLGVTSTHYFSEHSREDETLWVQLPEGDERVGVLASLHVNYFPQGRATPPGSAFLFLVEDFPADRLPARGSLPLRCGDAAFAENNFASSEAYREFEAFTKTVYSALTGRELPEAAEGEGLLVFSSPASWGSLGFPWRAEAS